MKKAKTVFVCQECGYESPKWMGQCICGAWNSFVEEKVTEVSEEDSRRRTGAWGSRENNIPKPINKVSAASENRIDTGIAELNRVLGGGLVKGSLSLISGEPGIGKSTLIIQAASNMAQKGTVLYVSGEESEEQIKIRADRVCQGKNLDKLYLLSETNLEAVLNSAESLKPSFLIIDSIQTMYTESLDSAPGSVSQVRACGNLLMNYGKGRGTPVFIVAHVTKSGELAGPRIVEHLVDTVLQFNGERGEDLRILRAVKNRFGTTSEIGAFEMTEEGLCEIDNISAAFLEGRDGGTGCCYTAACEGTRPLLLEIQALTSQTNVGFAMRRSVGIDQNRLGMLIAVLERKAGVRLFNRDVYVNVAGGFKPEGTATDLAVCMAIYSQEKDIALPKDCIYIGEVGLTGRIRAVQNAEKLLKESARMGFKSCVLASSTAEKLKGRVEGLTLYGEDSLKEATSVDFSRLAGI